ncbi:MAG: hypothetical protein CV087_19710 [Candidatus Brocadia sp. WS118]|nr:MAG: hypothetical protein CV087_19710 [Candidatus Brocadia sp. WS118]
MNPIYQFFCWAGGGDIDVLKDMPTEHNRFFGYGTVIFMTAVFATLSSGYAFWLLLEEQIGAFIFVPALAWGAFIFVIDRFFIITISNRGSFLNRFLVALPRLILAVFVGIIISKPLEFRIFQREISDQLIALKTQEYEDVDSLHRESITKLNNDKDIEISKMSGGQEIAPLEARIKEWESKLPEQEKAVKAQAEKVNCECNGACGTGIKGRGPACKFEEQVYQRLLSEKNRIEADIRDAYTRIEAVKAGLQNQIDLTISPKYQARADSLEQAKKVRKQLLDINYKPSILNQQIALAKIQQDPEKPTAFYTVWFITLLFIFIEMAPMLLKLMTSSGAYESRLVQIEAAYSTDGRLRRTLDLEEYKSNRGLVQRLARSQRTIIQKALDAWHKTQLDQIRDDPEYFNNVFNENRDNPQRN